MLKVVLTRIPMDYVNVRKAPNSSIVGRLYVGTTVYLYPEKEKDGWAYITTANNITGYVSLQGGKVVFTPVETSVDGRYKSVLLNVPYVSQWSTDAQLSKGDCGPASVSSILASRGIFVSVDYLIRQADLPVGQSTYSFWELIKAAQSAGVTLKIHYPAYWEAIQAEIEQGRPVIPLLWYGDWSGNQDTFTGNHFVVVIGFDEQSVIVNDSNFWGSRINEGQERHIPYAQFKKSIATCAHQALFLEED